MIKVAVEDTLTPYLKRVEGSLKAEREALLVLLHDRIHEYGVEEDMIPREFDGKDYVGGFLQESGELYKIVSTGEAMGLVMRYTGDYNPISNREARYEETGLGYEFLEGQDYALFQYKTHPDDNKRMFLKNMLIQSLGSNGEYINEVIGEEYIKILQKG